jgi:putative resolvase
MLDEILDFKVGTIIIAYKDRLSRTGFELFSNRFAKFGTKIIVVSEVGSKKLDSEEIFDEIISMLHCYSMKHYSRRKNDKIIEIEVE